MAETQSKISLLEEKLKAVKASDIMSTDVKTCKLNIFLADLAEEMIKARISGMPVLGRNGNISGVVTTTDLLIVMGMILEGKVESDDGGTSINPTVDFAMSSEDIISVTRETTLDEIVRLMRGKSIHTIPVMEEGQLLGVVGKHDVLRKFYAVVKDLK